MRMPNIGGAVGSMNARDRRAIMLGLAVLVPALLFVAVVRPYRAALSDIRDRTASELALLQREEALLAMAESLPDNVHAMEDRARRTTNRLVRAANVPLAEAEITSMLETIASLSRVLLQEMGGVDIPRRSSNVDSTSAIRALRLSVRGESDLEGVLTFLQRIESNPLLLRIVELTIEPNYEGDRDERVATGVVQFTMAVEAYAPADIDSPVTLEEGSQ
jgi:hypothetical protein